MRQDIFVGRIDILKKSQSFLKDISNGVSRDVGVLTLQGVGGIGKTKLVSKIREQALDMGFICTTVIDLKATSHRSTASLLDSIIQSLYESAPSNFREKLAPFFEIFIEYNQAQSRDKYSLFDKLVDQFFASLQDLSNQVPVLLLLDTFETVQKIKLGGWLKNIISKLSGKIAVVVAGREDIHFSEVKQISFQLGGLSAEEINQLAKEMFVARDIGEDFLSATIIDTLAYLTEGRPILITLAVEWILEDVEPEKIITIPRSDFEREIVLHIKDWDEKSNFFKERPSQHERLTIILMATLSKRFDENMLSILTGWDIDYCQKICGNLERFFFVKTSTNAQLGGITLHDEMIRLINLHVDYPLNLKNQWRKSVSEKYYPGAIQGAETPQLRQAFTAEKIYYQLHFEPANAIFEFDQIIQQAISGFDFEFADLMLAEASSVVGLPDTCQDIVKLNHAELLLKRYQPFDAKLEFDELIKKFDAETQTKFLSRAIDGLGACIANGATVVEANIAEAIKLWEQSSVICKDKGLTDRLAIIYYQLGIGYDLLGQHEEAIINYDLSNKLARELEDWLLVTKTLDEMGRLRRKRYEVQLAMDLFQESLKLKESLRDLKSMGVSYHYIGDAYRDLDKFDEALKWYQYAETARKEVSDDYGLCVLYGDIGWLYLLDKNYNKALEYTDKSYYDLAVPKHFGREMAEMEHSYYHIELDLHGMDAALPWIEKAFKNAETYSNTFIYLDAALHLIEAAYTSGQYEKIPYFYAKMDELDKKGCGYKMFKGRATNILGDIEHEKGKKPDAVNYWKEGYTIIAIHGRSRSSVKNFNDHLYERIDKLLDTLMGCNVSIIRDFISHWKNTFLDEGRPETLADEYPGVLGLLTMAEGDYLASQKEYEAAMEVWSQALYYWTLHMVVKDKKNILTLEHLSSNQLIIIKDAIKFTDKRIGIADLLELNSYGVSKEEKTRMRQLSEHFIAMLDE